MTQTGSSGGVYEPGEEQAARRTCFAILVANEPGVLGRIVGLFSGRGYNIESLTVDEVDPAAHFSRITIVTNASAQIVDQISAQVARLIPVRQVVNLTEQGRFVEGAIAFVKLVGRFDAHEEAKLIARRFGARIADTTDHAIIFEITSERVKIEQFVAELQPLGRIEVARAGSLAMGCGDNILGETAIPERQSA